MSNGTNPYQAPGASTTRVGPRRLTRQERALLTQYLKFQSAAPGHRFYLFGAWRRHLYLVGWLVLVLVLSRYLDLGAAPMIVVGMALGVILNDLSRSRLLVRLWPLFHHIFDWDRIRKCVDDDVIETRVDDRQSVSYPNTDTQAQPSRP